MMWFILSRLENWALCGQGVRVHRCPIFSTSGAKEGGPNAGLREPIVTRPSETGLAPGFKHNTRHVYRLR